MKMSKRDQYLSFRLSEEENQRIREQAISLNLTISEFMRRRLFDKQTMPVPESDIRRITELKQLGRVLKQTLLESTKGTYSQDMADAIQAIGDYAREQVENFNREKNENGTRKKE